MSSANDRFQHLQSEIDGVRKHLQRLENRPPEEPRESEKRGWWDYWNGGLMTLFTGLLFVSSMLQWSAANNAITEAHTSFEIGTRAWVVAKTANIKPTKADVLNHVIVQEGNGLKDSRTPAVSVELVNAGHSPALDVATKVRFEVGDKLPTDDYRIPSTPKEQLASNFVVAPDGSFFSNGALLLTEKQFQDITQGKQFLVAYGDITYDDIFQKRHETKFCYFYEYNVEKMVFCPNRNSGK